MVITRARAPVSIMRVFTLPVIDISTFLGYTMGMGTIVMPKHNEEANDAKKNTGRWETEENGE